MEQSAALLRKYTDKSYLIKDHLMSLTEPYGNATFAINMTPITLVAASSVTLNAHNRVGIKDLAKSVNCALAGKHLLCRSVCPTLQIIAHSTIVDDPEGELGARLALYNFVEANKRLAVGTVLAIKDPLLKTTADGGLSIRCDNPKNVVILGELTLKRIYPGLEWKGEIPQSYFGHRKRSNT